MFPGKRREPRSITMGNDDVALADRIAKRLSAREGYSVSRSDAVIDSLHARGRQLRIEADTPCRTSEPAKTKTRRR